MFSIDFAHLINKLVQMIVIHSMENLLQSEFLECCEKLPSSRGREKSLLGLRESKDLLLLGASAVKPKTKTLRAFMMKIFSSTSTTAAHKKADDILLNFQSFYRDSEK